VLARSLPLRTELHLPGRPASSVDFTRPMSS
jgi:hypothetical protein